MAFGIRRSFGAKIFAFVAVLVLLLVAFITGKNSLYLRDSLNRQYQSTLIDNTQLLGERITGLLTRWDTKLGFFVQALLPMAEADRVTFVEGFLKGEEGVEGMQVIKLQEKPETLVSHLGSPSWLIPSELIAERLKEQEIDILQHPAVKSMGILLRKIKIKGGEAPIAVALIFEVNTLLVTESNDALAQTYLLDRSFEDLLTRQTYAKISGQKSFAKKAQSVVKGDIGSGYLGELAQGERTFFVAYHQMHPYPLMLVVHQDTSAILTAIQSFIIEMVKWTIFFVLLAVFATNLIVKNLLRNLHELSRATLKVGEGNFNTMIAVRSQDEIGQLSASFNHMTRKILGLLEAETQKARLEQELSTAQTIQNTFFKDKSIHKEHLQISSFYKPASECGGDWWGYFPLGDGLDLVLIGDATGHGVPAALVTAIAYATSSIHAEQMEAGLSVPDDPSLVLKTLNSLLNKTLGGEICMSFLALIIDQEHQRLIYSNAGHPFPILLPRDPEDERLGGKKQVFRSLMQKKKAANILGIDPVTEFYVDEIPLKPGDKILIYTDGLTECVDKRGKQWGSRGLQKLLTERGKLAPEPLQVLIKDQVIKFNAQGDQFADDVTLVIIEYGSESLPAQGAKPGPTAEVGAA